MPNTVKVEARVQGRCPSCGLETLYVEPGGYASPGRICCSLIGCVGKEQASLLLERSELVALVAHGGYGDASEKIKQALGLA